MGEGLKFICSQFTSAEFAVGVDDTLAFVVDPDWHNEEVQDTKAIFDVFGKQFVVVIVIFGI